MKNLSSILLIIATLVCCDSGETSPDNDNTVIINGFATLYTSSGNRIFTLEGTTVKVVGTSLTGLTSSNGQYEIENVPVGTIDLEFSGARMGTHLINKIDIDGREARRLINPILLSEQSTSTISSATIEVSGSLLEVKVSTLPEPSSSEKQYITMFFGRSQNVTNTLNEGYFKANALTQQNSLINITPQVLSQFGFTSGETLFIRIYSDSFQSNAHTNQFGIIFKYDIGFNFPNVNPNSSVLLSVTIP